MVRPLKPVEKLKPAARRKREYYQKNPEDHLKYKKLQMDYYLKNRDKIRKKKSQTQKKRFIQAISMLGNSCEACGEKYDPNLKKTNLQIHHLRYDEKDIEKRKKWGSIGEIFRDVLRMAERGENPKKKFTLLCGACNSLEGWIRTNPEKALSAFAWCVEKGIIDVEKPDPEGNRQISDFLKF